MWLLWGAETISAPSFTAAPAVRRRQEFKQSSLRTGGGEREFDAACGAEHGMCSFPEVPALTFPSSPMSQPKQIEPLGVIVESSRNRTLSGFEEVGAGVS